MNNLNEHNNIEQHATLATNEQDDGLNLEDHRISQDFGNLIGVKKAIINADGIWKWRLNDYNENETTENFDYLIDKFIQYVAVKEDKSNFRIKTKAIYNENEDVIISAELYNDSYELINNSNVELILTNEAGEKFNYSLLPYEDIYKLNLGKLPKGLYKYSGKTELNGKTYKTCR